MLPKKNRLQKDKDFSFVFKNSKPIFTENLSFRVVPHEKLEESRFGFIVSNKVDKRATRRNALKRQLREVAGSLISELGREYDVVVSAKKDFSYPYDQNEIRKQFLMGLRRAGAIK